MCLKYLALYFIRMLVIQLLPTDTQHSKSVVCLYHGTSRYHGIWTYHGTCV